MGGSAKVKEKKGDTHIISYSKSSLLFVTIHNSMAKALYY